LKDQYALEPVDRLFRENKTTDSTDIRIPPSVPIVILSVSFFFPQNIYAPAIFPHPLNPSKSVKSVVKNRRIIPLLPAPWLRQGRLM
jgi:hypothetical protein